MLPHKFSKDWGKYQPYKNDLTVYVKRHLLANCSSKFVQKVNV